MNGKFDVFHTLVKLENSGLILKTLVCVVHRKNVTLIYTVYGYWNSNKNFTNKINSQLRYLYFSLDDYLNFNVKNHKVNYELKVWESEGYI